MLNSEYKTKVKRSNKQDDCKLEETQYITKCIRNMELLIKEFKNEILVDDSQNKKFDCVSEKSLDEIYQTSNYFMTKTEADSPNDNENISSNAILANLKVIEMTSLKRINIYEKYFEIGSLCLDEIKSQVLKPEIDNT
jgi:hypothetical protein